ncbi:5'-nucleotidase [Micromonospora saelicesensis]|uniref:LysM peptidoglycan-binding domain-containing protein n=1 Tax=Micromonospora saelicesensis TaxID=285676 RepID=UPI000DBF49A9|nr:5'-nucleotidase [Micromonospora saelicesensis]
MPVSGGSVVRRTGRILTGIGALAVLLVLLVGAPIALLAFAGNPLPDHLPTISEVGTALTSRDDGQLFLRALAVAGWFGWATFAFSVLVELGAQTLRRPAPKLPGMGRQQKAAAALVGSVALILVASPAAASAAAVYGTPVYASPTATAVTTLAAPTRAATTPDTAAPVARGGLLGMAGTGLAAPGASAANAEAAPVYRVARGDYLGEVAERYLDEFGDYRQLAKLNKLDDPDRIRPGQLLRLPTEAADQGARQHATGRLVDRPAAQKPPAPRPAPERTAPPRVAPAPPSGTESAGQPPAMTVGAARAGAADRVNRPLAVSAVLAVASIVGAQIGAVLGLRRRPATAGAAPRLAASSRTSRAGAGRSRGAGQGGGAGRSSDGAGRSGGAGHGSSGAGRRGSGGAAGSGAAWAASRAAAAIEAPAAPAGAAPGGATPGGATPGGAAPGGNDFAPRGDGLTSTGSGAAPTGGRAAPTGSGMAPMGSGAAPAGSGMAFPGSTAFPGSGMALSGGTAPPGGGMGTAGPGSWSDDDGWAGAGGEGGLFDGGHGLDSVPDGPPVGRHRRT